MIDREYPWPSSRRPRDAIDIPLPREEHTPPVTNINLVLLSAIYPASLLFMLDTVTNPSIEPRQSAIPRYFGHDIMWISINFEKRKEKLLWRLHSCKISRLSKYVGEGLYRKKPQSHREHGENMHLYLMIKLLAPPGFSGRLPKSRSHDEVDGSADTGCVEKRCPPEGDLSCLGLIKTSASYITYFDI